jgi:hypothetical protein
MRCPDCGLVHASTDQVCRRCEIDLKTGERAARASMSAAAGDSTALGRLRRRAISAAGTRAGQILLRRGEEPKKRPAEKIEGAQPLDAGEPGPRRKLEVFTVTVRKKAGGLKILGRLAGKSGVASISCIQCTSPMSVVRTAPYSRAWPPVLMAAGSALIAAGLFFHLLLITGALAVVAGMAYLRVGRTYWRCESCGFVIPRAPG